MKPLDFIELFGDDAYQALGDSVLGRQTKVEHFRIELLCIEPLHAKAHKYRVCVHMLEDVHLYVELEGNERTGQFKLISVAKFVPWFDD